MLIQSCTVFNLSILFVSVLYCSVESVSDMLSCDNIGLEHEYLLGRYYVEE